MFITYEKMLTPLVLCCKQMISTTPMISHFYIHAIHKVLRKIASGGPALFNRALRQEASRYSNFVQLAQSLSLMATRCRSISASSSCRKRP
jgi:hypothetical protein